MSSKFIYTALLNIVILSSCKKELPPQKINAFYKQAITADDRKIITVEEAKTYHVDTKRHYEYRTGKSGHYEYNYDVKGINIKGDSVFGNINIEGKMGAGILLNDSIEDIEINVQWVDYGKLKAVDRKGNEYQLIVH
jgi:hypothetical protein